MNFDSLRYFTEDEMRCKCGCGAALMQPHFMAELDALRHAFGAPLRVSSGYRCPAHNATVSSTGEDGPHTTGMAADLLVSGADAYALLRMALNGKAVGGFTGIGVRQRGDHALRFIHLDMLRSGMRPWVWSY